MPSGRGFSNDVLLRQGCRPTVFIDGMRLMPMPDFSIDDFIMAHDVEGIEVYQGIQAPAQFSSGSSCGSIMWTRRGEPGTGRASTWRGLAIGLAFMGLGILLTR